MDNVFDPADAPATDRSPRLSVGDPELRKTRRLTRECHTCIFKPGNLMHLDAGQLKKIVTEARDDAGYIICHSTLTYAGSPIPPALCRGFTDRYRTWQLQVMERLWGFVDIEPPDPATTPNDPMTPTTK